MNEVDSNSERARPLRGFQLGGGTAGIAGMYRRAQEMAEGSQDPDVSPYGTEAGTTQQMLDRMGWSGPMGYLKLTSGLRQAGWEPASGSGDGDLANTMWYPPEGTLTGGPGGPSEPPPRIIPTDPASYVGVSAEEKAALKESPYRDQLREHKAKIAATLGSARGGHVTGYAEGGTTRADNPFDPVKQKYQWRSWERKYGRDPDAPEVAEPPPEVEAAAVPEKVPWYMRIAGYGSKEAAEEVDDVVTGAQTGQAYGGRVRYQAGGLAIAAPAGGVPPWISPTGSGPGYMDEPPPGYQFGGIADRFNPPVAAPAAGPVPQSLAGRAAPDMGGPAPAMQRRMEQAQSAFNPQTGGPRGGVMGGQYRGVPPQRGMISRGAQPGGLAAMGQQARQQQRGFMGMAGRGEVGPGTSRQYRMSADEYRGATDAQRRAAEMTGEPGGEQFGGMLGREESFADRLARTQRMATGRQTYADVVASGRGGINPMQDDGMRLYDPARQTGGGGGELGNYDPRIRTGPNPNAGRPGWDPIGDMQYVTGPGTRPGKPRPGPGMMPPGEEGGGIPGGPRVPPNMRGYMQKQRMMNRPPANVGGGANRVGMQDQQGALSRAMQRGTGRAPPSRRFGRGRAGAGRGFQQR